VEEAPLARTPREDGFAMLPEWAIHEACLMAWPSRLDLWRTHMEEAKREYAGVARAIAQFEPVIMLCNPADRAEVINACGRGVETLAVEIDDSWIRDNGPIIVNAPDGRRAVVRFKFNGWGEAYTPYDADARVGDAIAAHLGLPLYAAPMVLEGGSFLVDGEGSLVTTEQCLLHPNRNPDLNRDQIEGILGDYLGVDSVIWMSRGIDGDDDFFSTDGHVDGVAHYVRPGDLALLLPHDPADPNFGLGTANRAQLLSQRDACGRQLTIIEFRSIAYPRLGDHDLGGFAYINTYLANGAAIMPTSGVADADERAAAEIGALFTDRQVVPVPARAIAYGGGGPHCITQQVPAASAAREY
jgi:agmatine deiminase